MKQIFFTLTLAITLGVALPTIAMDVPLKLHEQMLIAIQSNNVTEVERLIRAGINFNNEGRYEAIFKWAAQEGYLERLIQAGFNINTQAQDGGTLLHYLAANHNDEAICKTLLDHGANTNIQTHDGSTALMFAARNSHGEATCKTLLEHGADTNIQSNCGNTALMFLAYGNPAYMFRITPPIPDSAFCIYMLLRENGAHIDIQNDDGQTALHAAAMRQPEFFCHAIINHQKQINAATKAFLLCLYRMRCNSEENADVRMCSNVLYRQFRTLVLPHLNYVPLKKLLNVRDRRGLTAYNRRQLECLNPELLNPEPNSGWFSNCSIQ